MTPLLRKLLGINWVLLLVMLALAIFGVIAIYSCTHMQESLDYQKMWHKQAQWIVLGMVVFLVASLIDYRWIRWGALPIYCIGLVFLLLTLLKGRNTEDASRWLQLGPIKFQPAQLAILGGILIIALFLTQFHRIHPMLKMLAVGIIAGAPALLILIQPDLGSCLIWAPVVFAMLFIGRIPKRYLIVTVLLVIIAMPVAFYFKLKPYQRDRIMMFLHPESDPQGKGWAINRVLIAIGSGGWGGKGFLAPDSQVELGLVPRTTVPSDYIFAPIGEQGGFVVGTALLMAFAVLLGTCLLIATLAADELGTLVATGVGMLVFAHVFQNVGMCVSLLPVTGIPLPLISYGGTFLVVIMFCLGLVNSVWVHRKTLG